MRHDHPFVSMLRDLKKKAQKLENQIVELEQLYHTEAQSTSLKKAAFRPVPYIRAYISFGTAGSTNYACSGFGATEIQRCHNRISGLYGRYPTK